jgi:formyltetrahydrofolate synthetase
MAKIKSNFNIEKHFVLTNGEEKIMAIIHLPAGKNDVSEKIIKAISENENAESVILSNQFVINKAGATYMLNAVVFNNIETSSNYYNLTEACIY